jgi:hypothetical protein
MLSKAHFWQDCSHWFGEQIRFFLVCDHKLLLSVYQNLLEKDTTKSILCRHYKYTYSERKNHLHVPPLCDLKAVFSKNFIKCLVELNARFKMYWSNQVCWQSDSGKDLSSNPSAAKMTTKNWIHKIIKYQLSIFYPKYLGPEVFCTF